MTQLFGKTTTTLIAAAILALAAFKGPAEAQAPAPNKDTATNRQDRVTGTQNNETLIIQHRSQTTGDRTTIVSPAPSEDARDESYGRTPIMVYPEVEVPVPPQRPKPVIIYKPGQ